MSQRPGDEETRRAGGGADEFWRRYTGRSEADEPAAGARPGPEPGGGGDPYAGSDPGARPRAGSGGGSTPFDHGIEEHECLDWCPICRGAEVLRASVPPELREQYHLVQRDILQLANAAIESHLARMQEEDPGPRRTRATGREPGPGSARGPGDDRDPGIRDIPID